MTDPTFLDRLRNGARAQLAAHWQDRLCRALYDGETPEAERDAIIGKLGEAIAAGDEVALLVVLEHLRAEAQDAPARARFMAAKDENRKAVQGLKDAVSAFAARVTAPRPVIVGGPHGDQ